MEPGRSHAGGDAPERGGARAAAEPDTWQYALALFSQAQFDMLADRNAQAVPVAEDALARAEKLGRWDIYVQALTCLRTAQASVDLDAGLPGIRATIEEARQRGESDTLPRLYANLTSVMTAARRHDGLSDEFELGIAACAARDQAALESWIRGNRAAACWTWDGWTRRSPRRRTCCTVLTPRALQPCCRP
jgi:hypothetical protein